MSAAHDPGLYDLFVSYSTRDNAPPGHREGWVQVFVRRVRALAVSYTSQNLTTTSDAEAGWDTFYAPDEIHAGQDWEARLRSAVAHSRVLLACLSDNYWRSAWCRMEWETYLQNEAARGLAHMEGGITPIYIASAVDADMAAFVAAAPPWAKSLLQKRQVQLLPFTTRGLDDLARLKALHEDPATLRGLETVAVRISGQISHARRAEGLLPGNLAAGTDTFVGREQELLSVEKQLFGGGALGVITALRGLGGQGKTALALRYGHNLRARYTGGCWQTIAEGATELLPLVAGLREPLGLAAIATDDDPATARRVLAELHRRAFDPAIERTGGHPAAALLVVDNVDRPVLLAQRQRDALRQAMARAGLRGDPGWLHLLATTRLEADRLSFLPRDKIIAVDALPMEDALALWQRIIADPGQALPAEQLAAAESIIELLDRHTLAVEVAARHIRRTIGQTPAGYLARLRKAIAAGAGGMAASLGKEQERLQREEVLPGYTNALDAALRFTFDQLAAEDPAAATVLHYAAHFPAEAVPLPWLRTLAGQHHPELLAEPDAPGLPSEWDRAALRLTESLRLLTHADGEAPQIARLHRLAGDFLRQRAQQAGEDASRRAAVEGFIDRRTTLAEQDHRAALQPWERAALLADLPIRVARPDCPSAIAQSVGVLIDVLRSFSDTGTARRLALQQNAAFQRHLAARPDDPGAQRDLSVSLNILGGLAVAQGDGAGALRYFTEGKTIRERLAASDPANAAWQRDLSVSLNKLGDLAVAQGDGAGALRYFTQGKTIAERLAASDPANAAWQRDLSVSLNKLGDLAVAQGDGAGALRYFTQSKTIAERLAASDPANAAWQRDLSVSLNKLGDLAVAQGDGAGALRYFTQSKTIAERLAASDPANAAWQRDLSVSLNKLGDLAVAQGDGAGALRYFTQSKTIRERLAASDPANAEWQRDLSVSLNKLGDLAVAQGDGAGALRYFTQSKTIRERLAASDPANAEWQRDLSVSLNKLGDLAVAQGDGAGALRYFTQSHAILERLAASDPANAEWQRDLSVSLNKLGDLAVAQGDGAGALRYFTQGKTIAERLAAGDPANAAWQRDLSYSLTVIAQVFMQQERWGEALKLMERSLAVDARLAASDRTNVTWQKDEQVSRRMVAQLRAKVESPA